MSKPSWKEQQERDEIAARRKTDQAKRDPELETAVIAYCNHRRDGGSMKFEDFRRQFLARRD